MPRRVSDNMVPRCRSSPSSMNTANSGPYRCQTSTPYGSPAVPCRCRPPAGAHEQGVTQPLGVRQTTNVHGRRGAPRRAVDVLLDRGRHSSSGPRRVSSARRSRGQATRRRSSISGCGATPRRPGHVRNFVLLVGRPRPAAPSPSYTSSPHRRRAPATSGLAPSPL